MKQIGINLFIFLTLSFGWINEIERLQWVDPYGREPIKYRTWYRKYAGQNKAAKFGKVYDRTIKRRQNLVDIVVNAGIYQDLAQELDVFTQDLLNAGYSIQVDTISGVSHTELRNHLASLPELVGAIFVGEIPVAWFETAGEEYPHDIYFCDLNGTYIDADGDGIYDDHTGSVAPEIWVGRIYARNLTWDSEIRLLKRYFRKNHLYRVDSLALPQRALSFVDDDWSYWTTCYLDYIYSNVVVVNDDYQTVAANYRNHLMQGYEWIHLCAHSSPWGHTFVYPPSQYRGTVFNYEIFTLEPHALFYNLFACSGTRFVEENYSAGWYIFIDPYGILAVGSTKTGSMLCFEDFYGPIGQQDMCIGDAFKYWFTLWGETSWDWFYGMNILGDPTLKPKGQTGLTLTHKKYSYHGITDWEPPETIAPDPESDAFPEITANRDGKIWLVWESGRSYVNGRSEIYGAYRDAGGWSNAMNIGPHVYWDYCPAIGVDNLDRPVAVWAGYNEGQYDLYYSIYTGSWSIRQLVHTVDTGYDLKPAIIRDKAGRLWVAWESRRNVNSDIYASYFNGTSWSSPQRVTTNSADETNPVMLVDSLGKPWVVYARRAEDRSEIWGSYYTGSQWVASGPISGSQKDAYHPACAVDEDGIIWVVWQSSLDTGNPDIFASYFNGSIWSSSVQITTDSEADLFPVLTTDTSGTIWLAYQSKTGGDWNIYYAYYIDSTWSNPEIVADLSGPDINPQIACSNSNELWICWQGYSSGNWEIMVSYKPGYGVNETEPRFIKSAFSVSPTIFSKNLKIVTKGPNQKIAIYDKSGSLLKILSSNKDGIAIWSPYLLPAGTYFIVTKNKNNLTTKKVLFLH